MTPKAKLIKFHSSVYRQLKAPVLQTWTKPVLKIFRNPA